MKLTFPHLKFHLHLIARAAVLIAALCVSADAQHLGIGGKVGGSSNGYEGAQAGLWLTGEATGKKAALAFDLDLLRARKQQEGTGTARLTKLDLSARYFLNASVFVSGDVGAANLSTDLYSKSAVGFGPGVGFRQKGITISGRYLLPDTSENKQQGFRFRVEAVRALSESVALKVQGDIEATRYRYKVNLDEPGPWTRLGGFNGSLGFALVRRF